MKDNLYSSIRLMEFEDIKRVLQIEQNFKFSLISEDNLKSDLMDNNCRYYILEKNNNIIGFIGFSYIDDFMDLLVIAIDKESQNLGYGALLIEHMINFAKENNLKKIFLEVRVSNKKAIRLYEKYDFKKINIRKKYYKDNYEDAYIYLKELT